MPLLRKGFKDSLAHDDLWTLVDSEQVSAALSLIAIFVIVILGGP